MASKPTPPSTAELHKQLLAVAKVVDGLEHRIENLPATGAADAGLADEVRQLRADQEDCTARLQNLQEVVGNLIETTNELAGAQDEEEEPPPTAWVDAPADAAPVVLVELVTWMNEVLVHYPPIRNAMYPCWYHHPALVQLLLDVRAAWLMAYRHPKGEGKVLWALDWQERHMPHVRQEIGALMKGCSSVKHEPPKVDPVTPTEAALQAYGQWWATGREPGKEPQAPVKSPSSATPRQGPTQQEFRQRQAQPPHPPQGAPGWGRPT